MLNHSSNNSSFLRTLNCLKNYNQNPFNNNIDKSSYFLSHITSLFGFYDDNISNEVRCPICLQRSKKSTKPSNCKHIFCNFCIKKWSEISNKCPICRQEFQNLIKVDIHSKLFPFQGDLYI